VKRLLLTPRLTLQPMNAAWSPIYPDPDDLDIFGVVTHIIHRPRRCTDVCPGRCEQLLCQLRTCFPPGFERKAGCGAEQQRRLRNRRSAEAKPWIKMGTPWFQMKNERYPEKIYAFSSNYELYASMSARVMSCLEELARGGTVFD
jgi:hypothetical protein